MSTPGEGQREALLSAARLVVGCFDNHGVVDEGSIAALRDAIHNAGASVTEPAPHCAPFKPDAIRRAEEAARSSVRAGADVEGPSEPEPAFWQGFTRRRSGGRWRRVDNATFNYLDDGQAWCREESEEWESALVPVFAPNDCGAAPATQEAPRCDVDFEVCRWTGATESLFCNLPAGHEGSHTDGKYVWDGGHERDLTSPSAPAEPLDALDRLEARVEKSIVEGARGGPMWLPIDEMRRIGSDCATVRAALSVSTSAPKETSEPPMRALLWQLGAAVGEWQRRHEDESGPGGDHGMAVGYESCAERIVQIIDAYATPEPAEPREETKPISKMVRQVTPGTDVLPLPLVSVGPNATGANPVAETREPTTYRDRSTFYRAVDALLSKRVRSLIREDAEERNRWVGAVAGEIEELADRLRPVAETGALEPDGWISEWRWPGGEVWYFDGIHRRRESADERGRGNEYIEMRTVPLYRRAQQDDSGSGR